jgi:predicted anti-sigma-YlaC factor YlaD
MPLEPRDSGRLTCRELIVLVTDYMENALTREERARFERHLSACRDCTAYLSQMKMTIQLLGKVTEDDVTAQARDELLTIFQDWKR